jgi:hypothetical protein
VLAAIQAATSGLRDTVISASSAAELADRACPSF